MKHIFRLLLRSPMFTFVTLLTLAIGIGANTAIFSVVEGILLKPLPYPQPDRLVSARHTAPGMGIKDLPSAPSYYFTYREEGRVFQDIGLWARDMVSVTGLAEPEQVPALKVTDGTLGILGVQPFLGRSFTKRDDTEGSPETVMLSYGYWQRRFGGDRNAIGRRIAVDGVSREIIGVLPATFQLGDRAPSILAPFRFDRSKVNLGNFGPQSVARLKPGVTMAQASADIARMIPITYDKFASNDGIRRRMFEDARVGPSLRLLKQDVVGDIGNILWVLMGTIGIVLLIACANVANLLLVRAEGRQQELAIRVALGASQGRIAGDLLLESVTLGVMGGALGLAVAYGAIRALVALAPASLPRVGEISIDPMVLLFALAVSLLSGVLFGLIPMFKYAGARIAGTIRQGGRGLSQSRERHRARSVLVVVQVALALVLLIGSGLMIRTFQAMRTVQPGFTQPEQVQTLTLSIPSAQVADPERVLRMQEAILRKLAQLPGVNNGAFATTIPMDGTDHFDPIWAEGFPVAEGKLPPMRRFKFTSPGLLSAIGNRLLAGRDYTWTDIYNAAPMAIVTDNLAREYWGSAAAAVGKRIRESPDAMWREVIGVAGDERDEGVDHAAPKTIYWPALAHDYKGEKVRVSRTVTYALRSSRTGTAGFLSEIQQAVWSVNPDLPLAAVRTLEEMYSKSMARTSFALVMLAIAGAMALVLGIIGIYGVISYSVSQRTREIGIRMALGAQQPALMRMFVGQGLKLVAIGLVFGVAAAFALTRGMSSLLFGVSAADPVTYFGVSLGLAAASALASYLPSRRAATVDPVEALRAE